MRKRAPARRPVPTVAKPVVVDQPTNNHQPESIVSDLGHTGAQDYRTSEGASSQTQERGNIAPGETNERLFPGEVRDDLYLSREDLREYGIEGAIPSSLVDTAVEGDRVYCAMRAPSVYGKSEPGHARRIKRRWSSFQPVLDKEGNHVYATDDAVFYTVSREEYVRKDLARRNQAAEEFTRGVIQGGGVGRNEAESDMVENFRGNDPNYVAKKYQESKRILTSPGFKDKWPKNMTIEQIEQHVGDEETIRIERKYARGGRTERKGEYDKYFEAMKEKADKAKNNRTFSAPGSPTK